MPFYDIWTAMSVSCFKDLITNCRKHLRLYLFYLLKEWSFITRSLIDWYLCYICFLLKFSTKLCLPPLLMKENWGELFWLSFSFTPRTYHCSICYSILCHLSEFSLELWQREGLFKNHSLAKWTVIWTMWGLSAYKTL